MSYNQVVIGDGEGAQTGIPTNPLSVKLYGSGGNVSAITVDGELLTTETERENDVWSQYFASFSADTYVILISKDNAAFPHKLQGQNGDRIDITSVYYAATMESNTDARILFGVITRIDGTNADIKYCVGVPLLSGGAKEVTVVSLRGVPSQVKADFNGLGVLQHGVTNMSESNVAAVNTGVTLASPIGNIAPGLGDIVIKYDHTSGGTALGVFAFYHNTD